MRSRYFSVILFYNVFPHNEWRRSAQSFYLFHGQWRRNCADLFIDSGIRRKVNSFVRPDMLHRLSLGFSIRFRVCSLFRIRPAHSALGPPGHFRTSRAYQRLVDSPARQPGNSSSIHAPRQRKGHMRPFGSAPRCVSTPLRGIW